MQARCKHGVGKLHRVCGVPLVRLEDVGIENFRQFINCGYGSPPAISALLHLNFKTRHYHDWSVTWSRNRLNRVFLSEAVCHGRRRAAQMGDGRVVEALWPRLSWKGAPILSWDIRHCLHTYMHAYMHTYIHTYIRNWTTFRYLKNTHTHAYIHTLYYYV